MLSTVKERLGRDQDEQGFTLIELMVVVLIIAILLAIAIPTFLSARNSANARAAQSNLRNALTAEQSYWTNNQAFDATPADMQAVEGNINWATAGPTATDPGNTVAVALGPGSDVFLMAYGKDKNCYEVYQTNGAPVSAGGASASTLYQVTAGACDITTASAAPTTFTKGAAPSKSPSGWYTSF